MSMGESRGDGYGGSDWHWCWVTVAEEETVDTGLGDIHIDENLLLDWREDRVSSPREVSKLLRINCESYWSLILGMSILGLVLVVPEGWEVVVFNWAVATESSDSWTTLTLSRVDVTFRAKGSSNVTVTRFTSQLIVAVESVESISALVAGSSSRVLLTHTLSAFQVAGVQSRDGSIGVTLAASASILVMVLEVPECWLTLVADSSSNMLSAGTKLSWRHFIASLEVTSHSRWVAVAFFANREVVEIGFASITSLSFEISLTVTLPISVTGLSLGSSDKTLTSTAVGIVVESSSTLVTSSSGEVSVARTLSRSGVTFWRSDSGSIAGASLAIRVSVEGDVTTIAFVTGESFLAEALTGSLVANSSFGSHGITVAEFTIISKVSNLALVARQTSIRRLTLALSSDSRAIRVLRSDRITNTVDTPGSHICESSGARVTELSSESWLTWTLSVFWNAHVSGGSINEAFARLASRWVVVSRSTLVTVLSDESSLALALSSSLSTRSSVLVWVAIASLARLWLIPSGTVWTEVSIGALVTVDSLGVVPTVHTNTSSLIVSLRVDGLLVEVHLLVVVALVGSSEAVASLAGEVLMGGGRFPFLLNVSRTASLAHVSASVVFTATEKRLWSLGIEDVTGDGVTIANATSSDHDFLDGVEVSSSHCRISPLIELHQVSLQSSCSEKSESDVGGSREVLKDLRSGEFQGSRAVFQNLNDHFSVFQWL